VVRESYGQTSAHWLIAGGGGGGGAGADGRPNMRLNFQQQGSILMLSWEGGGNLESAPLLGAPFNIIINASSPFPVPIIGDQQFFRVSSPCPP
jgi:hypothetical protein